MEKTELAGQKIRAAMEYLGVEKMDIVAETGISYGTVWKHVHGETEKTSKGILNYFKARQIDTLLITDNDVSISEFKDYLKSGSMGERSRAVRNKHISSPPECLMCIEKDKTINLLEQINRLLTEKINKLENTEGDSAKKKSA